MLKNRKRFTGIALLLLCVFIFSWASVLEAATYKDKAALWPEAWQAIAELSTGDVVKGYQDGYFRPDSDVTKLETVALLIRIIGKEDQAKAMEKATVSYKVPANLFWGRGYLIAAAEQGMLVKEHLYQLAPSEPATRAEVAVLVYHALKLSPTGATLNFSDAGQVPEPYRDFVASVVQNQIMVGLPGNVFKPNEHITRAQMTVLLSRLIDNGKANPYPNRWMRGTLAASNSSAGTITIKLGSYAVIDKTLAGDCQVFSGGSATTIGAVSPGAELKLVLDSYGRVAYIKVNPGGQSVSEDSTVSFEGRVQSVWLSNGAYYISITDFEGRNISYKIDPDAGVYQDGDQVEISALEKDMYVSVKAAAGSASEIRVLDTDQVRGEVVSATSSRLRIEKSNGNRVYFDVSEDVVVERNGSDKSIDDVEEGNRVEVTVYDGKALKVEILSDSGTGDVSGEITDIDSSGTFHITIEDEDGDATEYEVDDGVDVYRDGDRIDFDELDEGEYVSLELDSDDVVTRIEVTDGEGEVSGEIRDIDGSGTLHITIRDDDGDDQEYEVDDGVDVYDRDGDRIDFDELDEGEYASLELDSDDVVTRIEVTEEDSTVSGTVTYLSTGSTKRIRIEDDGGDQTTYYIDSSARYYRDGDRIDLSDIPVGCEVELTLENDEVTRIEITGDEDITVEGEITGVDESDETVTIEQDNGNDFTYSLRSSPSLRDEDGDEIDLGDLEEGWEVTIKLRDGEIYRLNVTAK